MRHRRVGKTLDRKAQPRNLMLRNMAASLILYEKIKTTEARAKAVRIIVDKIINIGQGNDIPARRMLLKILPVKSAVRKVLEDLSPRYKNKAGGYSRITKLSTRQGDAAKMVSIELIS